MLNFLRLFKKPESEEKESSVEMQIADFAHAHKDLLVIVAFPHDDQIFIGHNDKHVFGRIKTVEGSKAHIVRDLLRASTFDREIDRFVVALMEAMRVRRMTAAVNNFLQFIDGALYNIARKHRQGRIRAVIDAAKPTDPGAVPSPFQIKDLSERDPE
jgi:hypothetical protein